MTTLQQLKASVSEGWDSRVSSMCIQIIENLTKLRPSDMRRLTYVMLAKFVGEDPRDPGFQTALTILTSVEHHPLIMRFEFHDELADRDFEISAEDVFHSVDEGLFIHPRTGDPVHDFDKKLKPFFKATPEFISIVSSNGK